MIRAIFGPTRCWDARRSFRAKFSCL